MNSIRIHKVIALIISVFYLIGVWHRGDKATAKETRNKLFYCGYYLLFCLSLVLGAIKNEHGDDFIFLLQQSFGTAVLAVKLWFLTWKQNRIRNLLHRVCLFSIPNVDDYNIYNHKLRGFVKFVLLFVITVTSGAITGSVVLPLFGRILVLKIVFPLDYEKDEIAFWMATIFVFTEICLTITILLFSIIIWYVLFVCSLRYEVLGSNLKNMGRMNGKINGKAAQLKIHKNFLDNLRDSIIVQLHFRKCVTVSQCIRALSLNNFDFAD